MRKMLFKCDLCGAEKLQDQLIGFAFAGGVNGKFVAQSPGDCERHYCKACANGMREFLLAVSPAPAMRGKE